MEKIKQVAVEAEDPGQFSSILSPEAYSEFEKLVEVGPRELDGRVIFNVNSTAKGGGVAEMLQPLVALALGAGLDARWLVISGNPDFFAITKRLHNHLHGFDGDDGKLGRAEREVYERCLAEQAPELTDQVSSNDIVILHDPQTAGLIGALKDAGATVIWRCHVGLDTPNDCARAAWRFLIDDVRRADAIVFSREAFAWEGLDPDREYVIRPSIDAFSPKNRDQSPEQALAILAAAGIVPHRADAEASFVRADGSQVPVKRAADMVSEGPPDPEEPLITQVSRWDKLKDPLGVLHAFVEHVAPAGRGHLILAGPATDDVADDPEGAAVYGSVRDAWHEIPDDVRARVHLASLPMDDLEENAAIVNALQRHSAVVVQKSLAEGFGLTVAEAMWKARPVVASRIGGIQDQIVDGESGVLIDDPRDLREFGDAVAALLRDGDRARRLGEAARTRVTEQFLGPAHLRRYMDLIERLTG